MAALPPIWINTFRCPKFAVDGLMQSSAGALGGFNEFGTQSTPPVYYRKYSVSGSTWTWSQYDRSAGDAHINSRTFTPAGLSGWYFDPVTGWPPSPTTQYDITRTDTVYPPYYGTYPWGTGGNSTILACTGITGFLNQNPGDGPSGGGLSTAPDAFTAQSFYSMSLAISSKTVATFSMSGGTTDVGGSTGMRNIVTSGNVVVTLSDPDTEADAIARISFSSPTSPGPFDNVGDAFTFGIWSVYENRESYAFGYQKGQYRITISNLAPNLLYRVVCVWEARDATGDGSGDTSGYGSTWSNYTTDSFNLRAPSTTPLQVAGSYRDIPLAQGKQIRLKSVSVTPIAG